jgi:cytidyltransferase-like protein
MNSAPRTVFVSGRYDLLHAGHLQFFTEARALGDRLVVCFASEDVVWLREHRRSFLPDAHKRELLLALRMVDEVVIGRGETVGLDFEEAFLRLRPDILAVTEDDPYPDLKRELCKRTGAEYLVLPKTPPASGPISTGKLVRDAQAPDAVPLRVDFAGGWLDVPRHARPDGFIVNCAISPRVSLRDWPYRRGRGLGGSAAWSILNGQPPSSGELGLGLGWQDAAVIRETGLCVWRSGPRPVLEFKRSGVSLRGRLALQWTGDSLSLPGHTTPTRDFAAIAAAGAEAARAVLEDDLDRLAAAVNATHALQVAEGMPPLAEIPGALARKYCGGGWGGYALALFPDPASRGEAVQQLDWMAVEPFCRSGLVAEICD